MVISATVVLLPKRGYLQAFSIHDSGHDVVGVMDMTGMCLRMETRPGQRIAVAGWHGGGGDGHCGRCDSYCRPEGGGRDSVICVNSQVPGIPYGDV